MNFEDNFRRVGSVNVNTVKKLLQSLRADEWERDSLGPQYGMHEELQIISLVHDHDYRHSKPTRHPALKVFERAIRPVLAVVADFYDSSEKGKDLTRKHGLGYFVRANFARLPAGAVLAERRDTDYSPTHAHRVHVPILTNSNVSFQVGDETLCIPEGEIYEINNCRRYSVRNDGETERVHLVLDYVLKGEK